MDLPSLSTLLRVNGLTAANSPEDITKVLRAAGYKEAELKDALSVLHGAPAPAAHTPQELAAATVSAIVENTSTHTYGAPTVSLFGGRIGVKQFWIANAATLLLFLAFFFILEILVLPLYAIASGLSLLAPPELALSPMSTVILVGLGAALFLVPFIFFLILMSGLHVRRVHEHGLSASAWGGLVLAGIVLIVILAHYPHILVPGSLFVIAIYFVILSLPGTAEENEYGERMEYPSVWGSILGSTYESSNGTRLIKQFVLPVLYIQVLGLVLAYGIHSVYPRVSLPHMASPQVAPPVSALKETQAR